MRQAISRRFQSLRGCPSPLLLLLWVLPSLLVAALYSCSSIDCPVQNTVYTVYLVDGALADTLSVLTHRADGQDTVLLNRSVNPTTFNLPISYQRPADTLYFYSYKLDAYDTVVVTKNDIPHFESVDCSASFFHTLTSVTATHHGIERIVITNPTVDYDPSVPHFLITFTARP